MKTKILTPFAPILVESTRSIGYSFESAIADIIDNSVGNGARNIWVNFRSNKNPFLAIIDDGFGMNEDELENAMRYGSRSSLEQRDSKDLGRFGLGLKMASMSQCRKLSVISKKNNIVNAACWDLDFIKEKGDWVIQKFSKQEISKLYFSNLLDDKMNGTIVIWEEFDRISNSSVNVQKIFDEKIEITRDHIALVFHRFIEPESVGQGISIFFNEDKVIAYDPFLSSNPATQPLSEEIIAIQDSNIRVKPFILPYANKLSSKDKKKINQIDNLRQNQGFYVYRNKRLIIWGTWFRLVRQDELNKLARIRVDIPNTLDSIWEIDIKKSTATLPELIKQNLVAIVEKTIGRSERVYKYRGRKVNVADEITHIWNVIENRGQFQYVINREIPIFKMLENSLDERDLNYLDSYIKIIESSFPYSDVYYRISKSDSGLNLINENEEEVYNNALNMLSKIKIVNGDTMTFVNTMRLNDYFKNYPNVIRRIQEEYLNEPKSK